MHHKTFFSKTTLQMLTMSFVGLVIMIVMSLYVGSLIREQTRNTASVPAEH